MFVKRLPVGQKVGDRFIMTFGLKTDPPQKHLVVVNTRTSDFKVGNQWTWQKSLANDHILQPVL